MISDAVLSPCGTYRYWLKRLWDCRLALLNVIMLNPSTADATQDDPTIRRCLGFAHDLGFGSLEVTNLYALRSTDPKALVFHPDPVGPENDEHIISVSKRCHMTICAWGTGDRRNRAHPVLEMLRGIGITPHTLKLTKGGCPSHPLYLPRGLQPVRML